MRFSCLAIVLLLILTSIIHAATDAPTPPLFDGGTGATCPGSECHEVHPSGSGSTCSTASPCSLNEGLSQAQAGETVLLQNGTYNGRLDTVRDGSPGNHIIIKAANRHLAIVTQSGTFRTIWVKHNYITIDGLRVQDQGGSAANAVGNTTAGGQHHIIYRNLWVDNADGVGIRINARTNDTTDIILENNLIDQTGTNPPGVVGSGVYMGDPASISPTGDPIRVMITGNEIRGFAANCLDFKENVLQGWAWNNQCHSDVDRGLAQDGVFQIGGSEIYVYDNDIYNIDDNGPLFDVRRSNTSNANLVYNNRASNSSGLSILVQTANGNSSALPLIYNNTFFGLAGYTIDEGDFTTTIINNIGISRANNIAVPASNYFVDSANRDFTLTMNAVNAIDQVSGEPFSSTDPNGTAVHGGARDYGAYEFDVTPITAFFGPTRAAIGTDGTILSTTDPWQSTLEGASSGTFRLNAGTYNISGNLNLDGIKLATNNGADVTLVGRIIIEGSNTILEGLKVNADNATRCIEAVRDNESTGWNGIVIQANQIFGGEGGDCVRLEGNIVNALIKDNHIDGGAGPASSSGHGLNILGGCTRSGDDSSTPFTYTCRPEGTTVEHNLFTQILANHSWGSWNGEDTFQMQGQGNTTIIRNVFWEQDPSNEEYFDFKTPFAGTTTTFRENYIRGLGMTHNKSCGIVQGDWNPGQFNMEDNLFDRCAQTVNQRTFRGGVNKAFGSHNIALTGNIFNCAASPGDDLVFNDIVSFSATGNTIDNCQINGATISPSTNAFDHWQGTHANGASNPLTINMANGDFTLLHATGTSVFSAVPVYGDRNSYTELNPGRWYVVEDGGNLRYGINTGDYSQLSGDRLGEYALLGQSWGDFQITFEARSTEDLGVITAADFAVPFAFIDPNNYAYFLANAEVGFTALFVIESGTRSTIVSHPASLITDNDFHDVEITRTGNQVVVKYDDVTIFDVTDARLGAVGDLGYGSFNDKSLMDNYNVQSLTASGTFYVKTTGSDTNCTTIQTDTTPALTLNFAYACANADGDLTGDEIQMGTGEYNESLTIAHNGSAQAPFHLTNIPGESPILDGTGVTSPATRALIDLGSSQYIKISNLTIRDEDTEDCIEFSGVGVHLDNLTIDNCNNTGILFLSPPVQPALSRITNNTITNTDDSGISCFTADNAHLLIEGNTLSSVATNGGVQGGILGFNCSYAIVRGNTVFDISSGADTIMWRSTDDPSLAHHVVIEDNLLYRGLGGSLTAALRLHFRNTQTIVRRNRLYQMGIEVNGPVSTPDNTVVIYHNTSIDSGVHALELTNSNGAFQGIQLLNNAWIGSADNLLSHDSAAVEGGSSAVWMDRNAYKFSTFGIVWWSTNGINIYAADASGFADWRADHNKEPSGGVLTTLDQSQLFVDAPNFDFTPAVGSPLINAGSVALTATALAGSGTNIPVLNSSYFTDGFGLVAGDQIQLGGGPVVTVTDIIDNINTVIVTPSTSWTAGESVSLTFIGGAPDIGAVESNSMGTIGSVILTGGTSSGGTRQ